jgi:hypothetical protein
MNVVIRLIERDDEYETEASDGQDQVGQEDPDAPLPG